MNTIRLQSDGAIIDDGKSVETDPLSYLSFKVELAEDFTLRSFFRMITRYPLLVKLNTFFPS